jgi:iron(III) transport system permease protein
MFGNKGVITTRFFDWLPWLAWDIHLYGFTGIVIAEVVFTFPPAFMILLVALSNTDARLYEAPESLGAGNIRTFFMVTIPSIKFGLLSAIFVAFTLSFTDFGAPKVVGGQFNILAVDIYKQVIGQQNFGMGATVSIILLIPTVLAFIADCIVQRRATAIVTARSVPYVPKANPARDTFFGSICTLIATFILLMVFMAGVASLVKTWPYAFTNPELYPQIWTLKHYLFDDVGGGGYAAFWNSIRMAALTATTATTAIRQLDKEFESVAESMAVPFYKTFLRVTVPVCFPAILEIAVFYFVSSMATVSAVIFLYSSDNPLASVAVINMDDAGDTAPAAAMCMLIVFANVVVRSFAELVSRRFKRKTQGWRAR